MMLRNWKQSEKYLDRTSSKFFFLPVFGRECSSDEFYIPHSEVQKREMKNQAEFLL